MSTLICRRPGSANTAGFCSTLAISSCSSSPLNSANTLLCDTWVLSRIFFLEWRFSLNRVGNKTHVLRDEGEDRGSLRPSGPASVLALHRGQTPQNRLKIRFWGFLTPVHSRRIRNSGIFYERSRLLFFGHLEDPFAGNLPQ